MAGFQELKVWQKARELAIEMYRVTKGDKFSMDFGLRDQVRRSAVSIACNIAEGDERSSNRDSVRFLYIAKGSLAELRTQLDIAHEIGYLDTNRYAALEKECTEIGRMLGSLIKVRTSVRNI